MSEQSKIRIGISACLLGARVRYDGGHKRDEMINETLSRYFEFVPVCPEVDSGMGVPREPIQLVRLSDGAIKAVGVHNAQLDVTAALSCFSHSRMPGLASIRGYIVKSKSPSCGMEKVPIYSERGAARSSGRGIFTAILMQTYPLLPVEEEGRLCNPVLRETFLERVMVYERWRALLDSGLTVAKLIDFHGGYKLLILSHDQAAYRRLGREVARAHPGNLQQSAEFYGDTLMNAIKRPADRANHVNVLQHLAGYLRKVLDSQEKQELHSILEKYRNARLPLLAPVKLIRDHFRRYPNPYVARQVYLDWYGESRDRMLQNRR
ncbi:MAG: DUF523 and DUF1722 domain-containing protein [Methylococcaceae bacterium]|nr:DUF523 and DUF1722 domain-containing protein [Methylococcaceae bacterium]